MSFDYLLDDVPDTPIFTQDKIRTGHKRLNEVWKNPETGRLHFINGDLPGKEVGDTICLGFCGMNTLNKCNKGIHCRNKTPGDYIGDLIN